MEGSTKKHRLYLKNKKLRSRFKACLGKSLHKQVPYEIWQMILKSCSLETMGTLAQLCKIFEEFVEEYRKSNFGVALEYRREGQITLARKYLRICAKNGDQEAMFHLAVAYDESGWGIKMNHSIAKTWFEKLKDLKHPTGMIYYANLVSRNVPSIEQLALAHSIAREALALDTCKTFEKGFCYCLGLGVTKDAGIAESLLKQSAEEDNNEFAQTMLGNYFCFVTRRHNNISYLLKAANQGYRKAQLLCSEAFFGSLLDKDISKAFSKKFQNQ